MLKKASVEQGGHMSVLQRALGGLVALVLLLVLVASAIAQTGAQAPTPKGTLFFPVSEPTDPLLLKEVAFKTVPEEISISGGSLLNQAKLPVVRYVLGFAVVRRGSTMVEVLPGLDATPTMPISPNEARGMFPQPMEISVPRAERAAVGVFVLEVQFADGSTWKPGLDRIRAIVQDLVARQIAEPKQSKPTA